MDREEYVEMYGEEFVQSAEKLAECAECSETKTDDALRRIMDKMEESRQQEMMDKLSEAGISLDEWARLKNVMVEAFNSVKDSLVQLIEVVGNALVKAWHDCGLDKLAAVFHSDWVDWQENLTNCRIAENHGLVNEKVLAMARGKRRVKPRVMRKNINRVKRTVSLYVKRQGHQWEIGNEGPDDSSEGAVEPGEIIFGEVGGVPGADEVVLPTD